MFGDPKTNSGGWPSFRLDKVGNVQTGTTPATAHPEYFGGDTPFVRPAELEGFQPITKAEKYLSEAGVEVGRSVREGATLVGCIGQVGKTGIAGTRVAFNQQINAVEFGSEVDDSYGFICCTLMSPLFQARAAQSLLPILNKSRFSEIEIPVPPLSLQKEFAQYVTEIRELASSQATSRTRLDALFQSMLHRAFNGEL
jgi:type I restriction enzyme S subunit